MLGIWLDMRKGICEEHMMFSSFGLNGKGKKDFKEKSQKSKVVSERNGMEVRIQSCFFPFFSLSFFW